MSIVLININVDFILSLLHINRSFLRKRGPKTQRSQYIILGDEVNHVPRFCPPCGRFVLGGPHLPNPE